MTPSRVLRRSLLPICAAVLLFGLLGTPAVWAHDGKGVLVIESQGPAQGLAIPVVVRLTWQDDGHAAVDATVTATAVADDGTATTPVPLEPLDQDGRYAATVETPRPGAWTIRFTSVTPAATLEVEETVSPPTTTSTTAQTTTTTETPLKTAAETTPDEGLGLGGVLAAIFLGAVVIACAIGFYRSSRRLGGER